MTEQSDKQYMSGTAKLDGPFELKYTPAGKAIASARAEFNDSQGGPRFGELAIWEPETWFDTETWWERMEKGSTVGFRGTFKDRDYKDRGGVMRTTRDVNCYAIAPLWERPKRG